MSIWELGLYVMIGWGVKAIADGAASVWCYLAERRDRAHPAR